MLMCVLCLATLKMIYLVFWEIWNSCIGFGLVLDIARAYLSQLKFVHYMRSFTFGMSIAGFRHVDSWGVSEHWATGGAYVKVICDITGSRIGAGLIDREANVILFDSKKFELLYVKRSENKAAICLARLFVSHSGCIVSSEAGPYSCTPQECPSKCAVRCSATHHPGNCIDTCNGCCLRCHEVPPGTFGNKDLTPCYNSLKTKYGQPKCP